MPEQSIVLLLTKPGDLKKIFVINLQAKLKLIETKELKSVHHKPIILSIS